MQKKRWLHGALRWGMAGGAAAALAALAGCGAQADAAAAAPAAAVVRVQAVQARPVRQWDEFQGRIRAVDSVELRPRVSGYIEHVAAREGQEVRKGQLLFAIDARPYRAALASAQAQRERSRRAAELAQAQHHRAQQLVGERAISQEEADHRAAALAQAQAQVRADEAAVEAARLNLEFTEVRAPVAGRMGRALLTVGNLAQADQSLLTTVVSQDPVYVDFDADEHSYLRYRQLAGGAQAVRVGLADEQGFPHEARLQFMDNQLDAGTGTIRVRARLANPQQRFTPGLFARVQLQGASDAQALLIDDKAVLVDQDRRYVYVVGPEQRAERRDVRLGRMVDGLRVVESGLREGDALVVGGVQRIHYPGMPLQPQTQPQGQ